MSSLVFQQFLSPCRPEVNDLAHMEEKEKRTERSSRIHGIACWNVAQSSKSSFGITFHVRPFEPYLTNVNY